MKMSSLSATQRSYLVDGHVANDSVGVLLLEVLDLLGLDGDKLGKAVLEGLLCTRDKRKCIGKMGAEKSS